MDHPNDMLFLNVLILAIPLAIRKLLDHTLSVWFGTQFTRSNKIDTGNIYISPPSDRTYICPLKTVHALWLVYN